MSIARLRFMVAEDHRFQRSATVKVLERLGARTVHEADDGHAALRIIQNQSSPIDIIITDLDMPGMDGMEFLRHLAGSGMHVSIILASALDRKILASIATMTEAFGITLLGVVEKPLTLEKLLPLIELHRPSTADSVQPASTATKFEHSEIAKGLNSNQFEPFFQPKIALSTGRVTGAEALARWIHPELGTIEPYKFIGAMEDGGLINELTWVMLKKAAACCSRWRCAGLEVTVSVNLSIKSLSDIKFADRVTELVGRQNLEPAHMTLEITESAVTTEVGKALENLARLRMKGFGLSIDDYGTGYSSMQQLTRIAFTEFKIDKSFVTNAVKEKSARVILESSLDMARKLNITTVAEGVETEADYDLLCELGCDIAQGYLIARPMQYSAFTDWCRAWHRSAPRARNSTHLRSPLDNDGS